MTGARTGVNTVVIGVGNPYRRDDGIGPRLVEELTARDLPGVRLEISDGEPAALMQAWDGADLAVVVDAVSCAPPAPGTIHRTCVVDGLGRTGRSASSHGLGIPDAIGLAAVLGRAPGRLVVYAVEAAELGFGAGLTPAVAQRLPDLVRAVIAEVCRPAPRDLRPE